MIGSLEEFKTYQLAMRLGETVWILVGNWDWFAQKSMGAQMVRAADSIAANLAESLGRYSTKEARQFCYYARGSLLETNTWVTKAFERKLLTDDQHSELQSQIVNIGRMLNSYINALSKFNDGRHSKS